MTKTRLFETKTAELNIKIESETKKFETKTGNANRQLQKLAYVTLKALNLLLANKFHTVNPRIEAPGFYQYNLP